MKLITYMTVSLFVENVFRKACRFLHRLTARRVELWLTTNENISFLDSPLPEDDPLQEDPPMDRPPADRPSVDRLRYLTHQLATAARALIEARTAARALIEAHGNVHFDIVEDPNITDRLATAAREFVEARRVTNSYLIPDSEHQVQVTETDDDEFRSIRDRISNVSTSVTFHFSEIFSALSEINYKGPLNFETTRGSLDSKALCCVK